MSFIRALHTRLLNLSSVLLPPLTLIVIFVMAQWLHGASDLAYHRSEIAGGAIWRLLSGHLVHNNTAHLLLNTAGLITTWLIGYRVFIGCGFVIHSVTIAAITGGLLYIFEPQLSYYVGFSGALHGILATITVRLITHRLASGYLLGALLLVKLAWEYNAAKAGADTTALIGLRVATEAHFWGAISGLLIVSPTTAKNFYLRMAQSTQNP